MEDLSPLFVALPVLLLSPMLAAMALVTFRGRGIEGRWWFLVLGPALAYSILWVGMLIFFLPHYWVMVFLVPALREAGHDLPYWVPLMEAVIKYDWVLISVACAPLTAWLVLHLWPRWPRLVLAARGSAIARR